jgi:hypothetical protein
MATVSAACGGFELSERDDDFEFDFFDEPDEETVTQRRTAVRPQRRPGRGPRPPRSAGGPPGLTPILRLIGLVAAAIVVVVLLVFWIQGCQNDAKTNAYKDYMKNSAAIARASNAIGANLKNLVVTPGIKKAELVTKLNGLADQEQQDVDRAQTLDPPGHLRAVNAQLIEALQFRVSGLRGLADAFASTSKKTDADKAGQTLAEQAKRLLASDVVWDDTFRAPAMQVLNEQGIRGVVVPQSQFVSNVDLVSAATFAAMFKRLYGASTPTGTTGGLHGTGIVSTTALPQDLVLSETSDNKVVATTELAFEVAVQDTGDSLESNIPVTLTIQKQGAPIKQTQTIDVINPGETKKVVFRNFPNVSFGEPVTVKVDVAPVPQEANAKNNSADYPVLFSLPQ